MFHKSKVKKNSFIYLFFLLKYREIIAVKTVTLYNFVLLCQSRNMIGQFKKADLHKPIKILHFLTPARIQK